VPDIDVVDSTWICAPPAAVAAVIAEPTNWRRWWPGLTLAVDEWRGNKGVRWTVRSTRQGERGSMEVWLEPVLDGVVAHFFLRLDRADARPLTARQRAQRGGRYRTDAKRVFWSLGDQLDPGRLARVGAPPHR
jgi:hypothetical protein